jgi:hypothetical protein
MSVVTAQLCLNGTPVGSVDVGTAGQKVSECVVAAKASCMALLNAQLAQHGGDPAAATANDDEATVYEDNLVDDGAAEAADARLLGLGRSPPPKKHKPGPAAAQGKE